MQLAWDKGYNRIIVESDSLDALNLIKSSNLVLRTTSNSTDQSFLVQAIKELMSNDWTVDLLHVPRELNAVADLLVKSFRNLGKNHMVLDTSLSVLDDAIDKDKKRVAVL